MFISIGRMGPLSVPHKNPYSRLALNPLWLGPLITQKAQGGCYSRMRVATLHGWGLGWVRAVGVRGLCQHVGLLSAMYYATLHSFRRSGLVEAAAFYLTWPSD